MTVTAENLGGGGSSFPPKGTQVPIFTDDFNRPNLDSLGSKWANWWLEADSLPGRGLDGTRPGPYNCAINPSIRSNECVFWARDWGVAFTICSPWPLAWMTQDFVDQFAECDVTQIAPYDDPNMAVGVFVVVCNSGNPGSFMQQNGIYPGGYIFGLSEGRDGTIFLTGLRYAYGYNPSATYPLPNGGFGYFGLNWISPSAANSRGQFQSIHQGIGPVRRARSSLSIPLHLRAEARHDASGWTLTMLINGEVIGTAIDSLVGPGLPGLCCDQIEQEDVTLDRLATVDNFRAGKL